ncbi:hypothetical protein SLS62_001125 [Diatrype stigma]|uniref:Alternative oxidase n=1 Tax=Diatrype stigma TaxID=117547 RepID=A0AAN9UW76_9PEZI
MTIGPRKFPAFAPRRNLVAPTFCMLLLLVVWSFRLPRPSLPWVDPGRATTSTRLAPATKPNAMMTMVGGPQPPSLPDIDLADPAAPFVGWPLERVCNESRRVEGLVFVCDNNSGGIGNIRNYIQTCLRYALEAGATGLTIPRIRRRDDQDLANIWTDYRPFTYMFDEEHFRRAMARHCPHIRLYDHTTDIPGVFIGEGEDEERGIELITPKDFGDRSECHPWDSNRNFQRFGDVFRAWLFQNGSEADPPRPPPPSAARPRAIRFHWGVLWDWQVWHDGPEFATTFGHLLKFNDHLLYLGNKVLENMRAVAREEQKKQAKEQGKQGKHGIGAGEDGAFIGVHLRTESDAGDSWPKYEEQFDVFRQQAALAGGSFRAAYLATGNATEAKRFASDAATAPVPTSFATTSKSQSNTNTGGTGGIRVIGKHDLLRGEDLEALQALTFDQQGIVDAVVLLAADRFVGTMPSSFSVYVASKRHLRTGGLYTRPWKVGAAEGDGLSYVGGRYDKYWENWLFMWDGMWP